jgi:hypothetical protein
MSIDTKEDLREASPESIASSPEAETGPSNNDAPSQGTTEQPKRKGGRKPVSYLLSPS